MDMWVTTPGKDDAQNIHFHQTHGSGSSIGIKHEYDIVKAHGGELNVDTKEGEGAEVTIILLLQT